MAVFDAAALHILTADVEEKIDVRAKMGSSLIVGDRFDFTEVEVQRFFEQGFAVPGNAGFGDEGALRKAGIDVGDDLFRSCQRTSFVILIVRIENLHVFAQDDGLDRRRTASMPR